MRENEFRERLQEALGEPPVLPAPKLMPSDAVVPRAYPRGMAAIAIALAALLVLALVASRVVLRPQGVVLPAATPSVAPQAGLDSFPCSLAVIATSEAGNQGQNPVFRMDAGFVNIPTGAFRVDPSASVRDLPLGDATGPGFYSAELKRWVPASARTVSPDGRAYAYVKLMPAGATYANFKSTELHVYNVATRTDRKLWSKAEGIEVIGWSASGILADTVPAQGGTRLLWRIDPTSGHVSEALPSADPSFLPLTAMPNSGNYSYLGSDASGRAVFRLGSRDRGTKYSVVVIAGGSTTTLYAGKAGDAKDFDPGSIYSDAHGLWLGNFDGSLVWLWSQSAGLRSFKVTGLPAAPKGYAYHDITFSPAGACVPGVFAGADATGLPPATSPTPSPAAPPIDWSVLIAKPLNLQPLSAGASCPVSSEVSIPVKAQSGKWPNYGYGSGPAYVTGQVFWYSAGSQAILVLTDPSYTGPVLVRSRQLDGSGFASFSVVSGEGGTALAGGAVGLAQSSSPPYWGTWLGTVTFSAPGCYGIQLDGTSFSAVVVISVAKGPPPPG